MINWKGVFENQNGYYPLEISGNGKYYGLVTGRMRDPYTQWAQSGPMLVQMTNMPTTGLTIQNQINKVVSDWAASWRKDFLTRYPGKGSTTHKTVVNGISPVLHHNASFISLPTQIKIHNRGKWFFASVGKNILGLYPLGNYQKISSNSIKERGERLSRTLVTDSSAPGTLCGWVVIIESNAAADPIITEKAIDDAYKISLSKFEPGEMPEVQIFKNGAPYLITQFQLNGTYYEPLVDWGYGPIQPQVTILSPPFIGPNWPTGVHYGRVAKTIFPVSQNKKSGNWVYLGKGVRIGNGKVEMDSIAEPGGTGK